MKIQILTDNPQSWIIPYSKRLAEELRNRGHEAVFIPKHSSVTEGDILVLFGCEKIITEEILKQNKHNLVVHESALPRGKGWSPLTWQILEGKNEMAISLFEARSSVDSGDIYVQKTMEFAGYELIDELREKQGNHSIEMALQFVDQYPDLCGVPQSGEESFYSRRTPQDSELDIDKTIREQFNLLRVVDNERYPAYFEHRGRKYILKIESADDETDQSWK